MFKYIVSLVLLCIISSSYAQKAEFGLYGGMGVNTVPVEKVQGKLVAGPVNYKGEINNALKASVLANVGNWQAGANVLLQKISTGYNGRTNTYGASSIALSMVVNKKILGFHAGLSGGIVFPDREQKIYANTKNNKYGYRAGLTGGAQMGYTYFIKNTLGFGAEVLARITRVQSVTEYSTPTGQKLGNSVYTYWQYPVLIGITYKL